MRKAYSYLRFSTPDQARGDSYRRQMTLAVDYAAKKDLALDSDLSFADLGMSAFRGANNESGALRQFREAVDHGLVPRGSVLLVESLDRISRQTAWKALQVLSDIAEAGIRIVTLSDGREYDIESFNKDPMSVLMALLIFVRANEESEMKSQRSRACWAKKRSVADRIPMTARGPGWLRLAEDGSGWQVIEERAALVRRIFTLASRGKGERSITALLNREQIPTWGSYGKAPAIGKIWNQSSIAKILRNQSVIGTLIPFATTYENGVRTRAPGNAVEDYYPKIVSSSLWNAVRLLKATTNPCRGPNVNRPVQNVLGGLGRCALCGRAMTRVYRRSPDHNNGSILVCVGARLGADCFDNRLRLDIVEKTILSQIYRFEEKAETGLGAHVETAHTRLCAEIEDIDCQIQILLSRTEGLASEHVWKRIGQLHSQKLEIERSLSEQKISMDRLTRTLIIKSVKEFLRAFEKRYDRRAANTALRKLFIDVVIDLRVNALTFRWKDGDTVTLNFEVPTTRSRQQANALRASRDDRGWFQSCGI